MAQGTKQRSRVNQAMHWYPAEVWCDVQGRATEGYNKGGAESWRALSVERWMGLTSEVTVFQQGDRAWRRRKGRQYSKSSRTGSWHQGSASAGSRVLISGLSSKEGTGQSKVSLVYRPWTPVPLQPRFMWQGSGPRTYHDNTHKDTNPCL